MEAISIVEMFESVKIQSIDFNKLFRGLIPNSNMAIMQIEDIVKHIFEDKISNINIVYLNICLQVVATNEDTVNRTLVGISYQYNKASCKLKDELTYVLSGNDFVLETVMSKLNNFFSQCNIVSNVLRGLNEVITTGKNKRSFLNVLENYFFFKNVVCVLYDGKYFFTCITEKIKDVTIEDMLTIHKLYRRFMGFSNSLVNMNHRHDIFPQEVDQLPKIKNIPPDVYKMISTSMLEIMNKDMNKMNIDNMNEDKEKQITNIVHMIHNFVNIEIFRTYFCTEIQKRLMEFTMSPLDEVLCGQLAKLIGCQTTILCVEDVINRDYFQNMYRTFDIANHNGVYKNIEKFNRFKCSVNILNRDAWKNIIKIDTLEMKHPSEIEFYLESCKKLYQNAPILFSPLHSKRFVNINNEKSTAKINLILNNGDEYNIVCNLIQASVLINVSNKEDGITAEELGELMDTPLSNLTQTLNSLIISDVIKRSLGNSSNTSMIISINKEFYDDESTVDIREDYAKACKMGQKEIEKSETNFIDNLKQFILEHLIDCDKTLPELMDNMKELNVNVSSDCVQKMLIDMIITNIVRYVNNKYQLIEVISDIESDEDNNDVVNTSDFPTVIEVMTSKNELENVEPEEDYNKVCDGKVNTADEYTDVSDSEEEDKMIVSSEDNSEPLSAKIFSTKKIKEDDYVVNNMLADMISTKDVESEKTEKNELLEDDIIMCDEEFNIAESIDLSYNEEKLEFEKDENIVWKGLKSEPSYENIVWKVCKGLKSEPSYEKDIVTTDAMLYKIKRTHQYES
jgi:hypothetical protein